MWPADVAADVAGDEIEIDPFGLVLMRFSGGWLCRTGTLPHNPYNPHYPHYPLATRQGTDLAGTYR
jgi:hypothetical protein